VLDTSVIRSILSTVSGKDFKNSKIYALSLSWFLIDRKNTITFFSGIRKFQIVWNILFLFACFFLKNIFVLLFIFPVMSFRIESWRMLKLDILFAQHNIFKFEVPNSYACR
jgi:hypothetical protein